MWRKKKMSKAGTDRAVPALPYRVGVFLHRDFLVGSNGSCDCLLHPEMAQFLVEGPAAGISIFVRAQNFLLSGNLAA